MEIIANDQGNKTTPSVVAFTDTERLIGDPAKDQMGGYFWIFNGAVRDREFSKTNTPVRRQDRKTPQKSFEALDLGEKG